MQSSLIVWLAFVNDYNSVDLALDLQKFHLWIGSVVWPIYLRSVDSEAWVLNDVIQLIIMLLLLSVVYCIV